jgi:hypothetical protein
MQIKPTSNYSKSNVSFSAIPVREVSLLSRSCEGKATKALLVQLEKSDSYDNKVMDEYADKIFSNKSPKPSESIFLEIYRHFKDNKDWSNFFALVTPDKKEYEMLGCAKVSDYHSTLSLDDLYVCEKNSYKNKDRAVKGAGEILLGETIKFAEKGRFRDFLFTSLQDGFYNHSFKSAKIRPKHIHIHTHFDSGFLIRETQFSKFLKYCSKKYDIDYSKNSKY